MLEGINILETIENREVITDQLLWFLLCVIVFTIIACFVAVKIAYKIYRDEIFAILIAGAIAFVLSMIVLVADYNGANIITEQYNAYKCIVDDTVSFNDIVNNYEILGKDGDIYILLPLTE